jgi:hypothetical protein
MKRTRKIGGDTASGRFCALPVGRAKSLASGFQRYALAIRMHTPSSRNVRYSQRLHVASVTFPQRLLIGGRFAAKTNADFNKRENRFCAQHSGNIFCLH